MTAWIADPKKEPVFASTLSKFQRTHAGRNPGGERRSLRKAITTRKASR